MTATDLKGKKVLVLGLGLLGGGVATTNWLLDHGAQVTVTDLKDAEQLVVSVKKIEEHLKKTARDGKDYAARRARLTWALGGHSEALVDAADLIVVNPDVSVRNPYVRYALENKIPVANEGTLFYRFWKRRTVGITGTRGKTTTANWTHHFIARSVLTGNSTVKPFLAALDTPAPVAVTELSSFILEFFPFAKAAPDVAVITNLYRDHLNRHGTQEGYADAKANIFRGQRRDGTLILNASDAWTPWFLAQRPSARLAFFSMEPLTGDATGVWYRDGAVMERNGGRDRRVLDVAGFVDRWGEHNLANLLASAAAAHAAGVPWSRIGERIATLPQVPYRQEVVHRSRTLTVVNDTTATSPDGAIAALRRWGGPNCILICGGTDRELDYRAWAQALPLHITKNNTVFLAGSATQKMKAALGSAARGIRTYDTLDAAWRAALKRAGQFVSAVVLFSPGAKSFELFANEFDRGQQFNALVERDVGKR